MDREELVRKRQELKDRLAAIRRDLGGGLARDMEDQAQQLENQDTLMEISRVTEQELERIEQALRALDQGEDS